MVEGPRITLPRLQAASRRAQDVGMGWGSCHTSQRSAKKPGTQSTRGVPTSPSKTREITRGGPREDIQTSRKPGQIKRKGEKTFTAGRETTFTATGTSAFPESGTTAIAESGTTAIAERRAPAITSGADKEPGTTGVLAREEKRKVREGSHEVCPQQTYQDRRRCGQLPNCQALHLLRAKTRARLQAHGPSRRQ